MREFILTQRRKDAENAEKISGCLRHGVWGSAPASITSAHSAPLRLCVKTLSAALITFLSVTANALPLVWRADWPGSKPVETLVHRGTDIEFQPQWYINGELANSTNWTFQTFVQTNAQATGQWFGPLPGAAFSHTNDVGAAFYNVMVRAQMPGGGVNYTAFARLRMLDSPGFTPGELPLPVATIDFSKVVAINAPWLLPAATNDIGTIKVELGSISNSVSTLSAATTTNSADIATLKDTTATLSNTTATINSKIPSAASASNQLADKEWIDDEIDTYAAYYITYTAAGAAFPTRAALLNATVVYSGGAARTPTRNDYAVVLADESHGGAEWRYIYTVAAGATSGQWDAQYPIETNDYDGLSNKPQINGVSLTGNKTGADLGVLDLAGGTMTGDLEINGSTIPLLIHASPDFGDTRRPALYFAHDEGGWWFGVGYDYSRPVYDIYLPQAAGTLALTSDISAAISPTSPAFSNAILSVGLGIDTNTVAAINELVDSSQGLPVSGMTSVGALLLALAAAIAALKKRLPYALVAKTIENGAVTLDDRAYNYVDARALGSSDSLDIDFPALVDGKSRDFVLAVECGANPPAISYAAFVTIMAEDASSLTPEEGMNIYAFTEFKTNMFLASRKTVDTVVDNSPESVDQLLLAMQKRGIDITGITDFGGVATALGLGDAATPQDAVDAVMN